MNIFSNIHTISGPVSFSNPPDGATTTIWINYDDIISSFWFQWQQCHRNNTAGTSCHGNAAKIFRYKWTNTALWRVYINLFTTSWISAFNVQIDNAIYIDLEVTKFVSSKEWFNLKMFIYMKFLFSPSMKLSFWRFEDELKRHKNIQIDIIMLITKYCFVLKF